MRLFADLAVKVRLPAHLWIRVLPVLLVLVLASMLHRSSTVLANRAQSAPVPDGPPIIAGCPLFPADNIWNMPIDEAPLDPNSGSYIETIGADQPLHPDFGAGLWEGGPIGIPFIDVSSAQTKVNVAFEYADESDAGPYPIPSAAPIEGGADSDGDRHVLVIERDTCMLYELFYAFPQSDGSWRAGSGAIFDLTSNALRPDSWTSADAAGLPILPGLVRYEEVAAGEIAHALRFTAPQTRNAYVWPARHYASSLTATRYPPLGQRFRLRADFDMRGYAPEIQVILRALQQYGMILADNGSSWYISGAPDERWDNDMLRQLKQLTGADFEAVDLSSWRVHADSAQALPPNTTPTPTLPPASTSTPTFTPMPTATPAALTPIPTVGFTPAPTAPPALFRKSFLPLVWETR